MNDSERSKRIREAILASRQQYLRSSNARRLELVRIYRRAGIDLRNDIIGASVGGNLRYSDLPRLERLTDRRLGALVNRRNEFFAASFLLAASHGSGQARRVSRLLPGIEISAAATASINERAVAWLWDHVAEDGIQLFPRLWRLDLGARRRLIEALEEGIATGEAIHKTAENLLRGAAADADTVRIIEKAFGQKRVIHVSKEVQQLFTRKGKRNLVYNIERVLITETNRIYRRGALEGFQETGAIGSKWNLSGAHPRQDICDEYATADNYGLGPGCYPFDEYPDYPAHPLCLCNDTPVYPWEVS